MLVFDLYSFLHHSVMGTKNLDLSKVPKTYIYSIPVYNCHRFLKPILLEEWINQGIHVEPTLIQCLVDLFKTVFTEMHPLHFPYPHRRRCFWDTWITRYVSFPATLLLNWGHKLTTLGVLSIVNHPQDD